MMYGWSTARQVYNTPTKFATQLIFNLNVIIKFSSLDAVMI